MSAVRSGRAAPGVQVVCLARPEVGNALSPALVGDLDAALAAAFADPAVHTVLITALGRHFCTGFDLSGLDAETDASLLERFVRIELLLDRVWRAPVRVVAFGQGRIMGAGADLFAACDLRLLVPGASLKFPGAGFGIVLGTRRLARRVGEATALRWVSEGTTIPAELAVAAGLASEVVPVPAGTEAAGTLPPDIDEATARLAAGLPALSVEPASWRALRAALADDGADADLAALVRSAVRPGLKARIEAYRQRQSVAKRPG